MTDKKKPLTSESKAPTKETLSVAKPITPKSSTKEAKSENTINNVTRSKNDIEKNNSDTQQNNISKLAIFALIVAIAGTSGLFAWQQQQGKRLSQQIQKKNTLQLQEQQESFSQKFNEVISQINNTRKINDLKNKQIVTLNQAIQQLEEKIQQRQPSDWLLHETEYLIRIAARTLWLEHDTKAAIGLLKDADARLAELDDPAYLPVRELIHQDIKSLELMPKLQTDEIVLALMAMNKQVPMLPLTMVNLGTDETKEKKVELSNDINDWQSNLAKTWQKFLNDFIRVRQRSGIVEPLISPEEQQHLKQNLSLKIQLALWSATERKTDIYQTTLTDIQHWLNEFFDLKHPSNQHFIKALSTLQQQRVSFDYPSELSSLVAIRSALIKKTPILASPTEDNIQHTDNSEMKTEMTEQADKRQSSKPKNEGDL